VPKQHQTLPHRQRVVRLWQVVFCGRRVYGQRCYLQTSGSAKNVSSYSMVGRVVALRLPLHLRRFGPPSQGGPNQSTALQDHPQAGLLLRVVASRPLLHQRHRVACRGWPSFALLTAIGRWLAIISAFYSSFRSRFRSRIELFTSSCSANPQNGSIFNGLLGVDR